MNEPNYKDILLSLLASLTLCDHMGDVADDVNNVLEKINMPIHWEDWPDLGRELGKLGIRTLYGTEVGTDEEE